MTLVPGVRLGTYEILGPLGAGGMGEVYRARDHKLGREVALKTLPESVASDADRVARFEREGRMLAAVNHPAIAAIYGAEEDGDFRYIVMELVPGETLAEKLVAGPLPVSEALRLAGQIAEALSAAHEKGVIHRDLKPSNIKVTPEGKVKVLDLGLAKAMELPELAGDVSKTPTAALEPTRPGMILGTVQFMSPEQVRGKPVDKRTDIWAFGCVLFEMLSRHRAFSGETHSDVITAVLSAEPDWTTLPEATPPRVRDLLSRCLQKDLDRRLRDIGDARIEIARSLAETESPAARKVSPVRPSRTALFAWTAAAALAVALAGAWLVRSRAAAPPIPPDRISLAVLPFKDLSEQPNGRLLGDGLAETVSARLARVSGVQVVTSSAMVSAAEKQADPYRAAASVGADIVVAGSFQRADGRIRITFAVLHAGEKRQIAIDQVTGPASDLFGLQDEVADRVANKLRLPARAGGGTAPSGLETASQQERYVQALGCLQRSDKRASVDEAIVLLRALSTEKPNSALVHAALGRAYLFQFNLTREKTWAEEARASSARAQQLDAGLPEVDVTLGELRLRTGQPAEAVRAFQRALSIRPDDYEAALGLARAYDAAGDVPNAEATYRRAIQLQPSYWSGYSKLAGFYFNRGQYPRAAEMFRRVTQLAPDSARAFSNLGAAYHQMDRFEEALSAYRESLAIEPTNSAYSNAGTTEFFLGRYAEASRDFEKAVALTPANHLGWYNLADTYQWSGQEALARDTYERAIRLARSALQINARDASTQSVLAVCLARIGDLAGARQEIGQALAVTQQDPQVLYDAAIVASIAGEKGMVLDLIGRAVEAGCGVQQIRRQPQFEGLRNDPRFEQALQRKPPKKK